MYILYGETGEHSDYKNWIVGVFKNVEKAWEYRDRLREDLDAHDIHREVGEMIYMDCPEGMIDSLLQHNWIGFGVEYEVGRVSVLDS
jgi:hypothetical protein